MKEQGEANGLPSNKRQKPNESGDIAPDQQKSKPLPGSEATSYSKLTALYIHVLHLYKHSKNQGQNIERDF